MYLPSSSVTPPADAALLALLGDQLDDAIVCLDARHRPTWANAAAQRLFGEALLDGRTTLLRPLPAGARSLLAAAIERVTTIGVRESLPPLPGLPAGHPLAGRRVRVAPVPGGAALLVSAAAPPYVDPVPSISGIVRELNQSLEMERVVGLVARHAAELVGGHGAGVFTLEDDDLVMAGRHGAHVHPVGARIPVAESLSGLAVRTRRIARIADLGAAPDALPHLRQAAAGAPRANAIAVPLLIGGRPIGALCVFGKAAGDFDERDESLLTKLADHAAVAVENSRLYSAAARTARHAGTLAAVARELALNVTPATLYAGVARVATESLGASGVRIFLADVASQQVEVAYSDVGDDALLAEIVEHFWEWWPGLVLRTGQPRFEADVAEMGPDRAAPPLTPGVRALAFLPLLVEGRTRGLLAVRWARPRRFDEQERRLLTDVASQVSVAMRNASLVETLERRAAHLAEERELAEASAAIARVALGAADLRSGAQALLAAIAPVVPSGGRLLGVAADGEAIDYIVGDGIGAAFVGRRVPLDRSLVRGAEAHQAIRIDNLRAAAHPDLAGDLPDVPMLLVPLVARQRILGVLIAGPTAERWHDRGTAGAAFPPALVARYERLAAPLAVALDVLLMGEAERRRVERERMLATALATMDQPVFVLAPDGAVRYANRAALREYGYEPEEIDGLPVATLAPGTPLETVPSGLEPGATQFLGVGGLTTAQRTLHHLHRRKDGSEFPVAVTRATIRGDDGAVAGLVLGVRNLTEERRVAEQLRQHEKLAALGSLVAGVAHELNNPLTGISAFSQLLLEEELGETQRESVRLIKREADRAVGVIRDLLLFSRKSEAQHGAVDVNALLQLTVRLRTYSLRAEEITPVLELDPALPRALGDEQRLQQVFLNLVVNAEYAMHGRPVRQLLLRTRRADGGRLLVEVTDTGSGMTPETLRHVFEPFFTTKPAGVGTGLGLSVSYGIVQAHGGTIDVASQPGRGTTFSILLPTAASAGAVGS